MGYLPDPTPDMGEYRVEIRSESFYLSGADTFNGPEPHALWVYPAYGGRQGTVEILIEDIPKIEAALEQVRVHLANEGRPIPLSTLTDAPSPATPLAERDAPGPSAHPVAREGREG